MKSKINITLISCIIIISYASIAWSGAGKTGLGILKTPRGKNGVRTRIEKLVDLNSQFEV